VTGEALKACPKCDDSGYIEHYSGGFWTGENMRFRQEVCDCPCGDDVRREELVARVKAAIEAEPCKEGLSLSYGHVERGLRAALSGKVQP
jgi:hypothetical protein